MPVYLSLWPSLPVLWWDGLLQSNMTSLLQLYSFLKPRTFSEIQILMQGSPVYILLHFVDGLIFWFTSGVCIKQFLFLYTPISRRISACVLILYRSLYYKCRMNNSVHLSMLNSSLKTSAAKVFHCSKQAVHILCVIFDLHKFAALVQQILE